MTNSIIAIFWLIGSAGFGSIATVLIKSIFTSKVNKATEGKIEADTDARRLENII